MERFLALARRVMGLIEPTPTRARPNLNKWGAPLPLVPAGRLFDERVSRNLARRINDLLAEGHGGPE